MGQRMYTFDEQFDTGLAGEDFLDKYFGARFDIRKADMTQQRQELDRIFTERATGKRITVEYKTDTRAFITGNAFVEIVSNTTTGARGWAHMSQASHLMYYVPGADTVYVIHMRRLRGNVPRWELEHRVVSVRNDRYETKGILVPLDEFERIAKAIIDLSNYLPISE